MSSNTQVLTTKVSNSDNSTGIALCIPRVFKNWCSRVKRVLIQQRWGYVDRVDIVHLEGKFNLVFIHFAPGKWNMRSQQAKDTLNDLIAGKEVKIVYDKQWFWKIKISTSPKPLPKRKDGRKLTIDVTEMPVDSIESPVDSMESPVDSIESPIKTVAKVPVEMNSSLNDPIAARMANGFKVTVKKKRLLKVSTSGTGFRKLPAVIKIPETENLDQPKYDDFDKIE